MAMDIQQTKTLRIVADGDSSGYVAARNAMATADKAASAAAKGVEVAVTASVQKISNAGDVVTQLQRKYVDGAKQAQAFSSEVAKLGRALETGRATTADAVEILTAMASKLGLTADAAQIAATGNIALSRAVEQVNARLEVQRSGVDALAESYQRMAAQAREAQAAEQAQTRINGQLGVRPISSGSAEVSAGVFSTALDRQDEILAQKATALRAALDPVAASQARLNSELAEYQKLAGAALITTKELSEAEAIARARHDEVAKSYAARESQAIDQAQNSFNRQLGVQPALSGSAEASAAVFSSEFDRQDEILAQKATALRAALDPVAASQARLNSELAEYQKLAGAALITTKELSEAEAIARARHDEVAKSFAHGGRSSGLQRFQVQDIAYQAQDSITQAFGGSAPTTIGLQQGPQLAMAFAGQSGKEALSTLGSGLASLISPVNLLSIGFVTLGAAGIQAFEKIHGSVKPVADALKDEEDALKRIASAYGGVAEQASKANGESKRLVDAIGTRSNAALALSTNVAAADFFSNKDVGSARSAGRFGQGRTQFIAATPAFQQPIDDLQKSFKAGKADFDAFYESITRKVELDPSLSKAGSTIISLTETFKRAYDAMVEFKRIRDALFNNQGENGRLLSQGTTNQQDMGDYALFQSQQKILLQRSQQAFNAQVAGVNARSPGERADAARKAAAAQYNNDETPAQRNQRINQAGQLAEVQAQKALTDAQRDRQMSLEKTVSDQQMEINLIGKTAGEAAKLRQEYQLAEQIRQEAAKNGVDVDQKEIALIKQKSKELGDLTDQYNRAKLTNDLNDERAQIFRSPQDQQIASRLQSSGLPIDLQSNEANLIRQNLQTASLKDGVKGFFSDFQQSLVSNGGKIGQALGKSIKDTFLNVLTKIGDSAEDKLANYVVTLLTGTSGGATSASSIASSSGGLLGSIFGGGKSSGSGGLQAANSNLSSVSSAGGAVDKAFGLLGQNERTNNASINSFLQAGGVDINAAQTAWCAAFVNSSLEQVGVKGTGSLTANSFLNWGTKIDPTQILKGDVLVQNRGLGAGDVGGHVGFATGATRMINGQEQLQMLSGNSSNSVQTTWVNAMNVQARRATDAANSLTKLASTSGQATQGLGQLGQSLSSSFFPAAPAKSGGALGGWLSSLFMPTFKPNGAQASLAASGSITGLFANGTDFSPGGVAMVGENGRELVNLPRGSQVIPNHRTEAMMRQPANANNTGGPTDVNVGVTVDDDGNLQAYVKKVSKRNADQAVNSGLFNYSEGMRRQGIGTLNARYNSQKA